MVRTFSYKIFLTGLIQFLNIFELNDLISTKCYVKIIETLDLWGVFDTCIGRILMQFCN